MLVFASRNYTVSLFNRSLYSAGICIRSAYWFGICAHFACMEHISCPTDSGKRASNGMGLFLTLQGSGMVIGPLVSGVLWDRAGHTAPFIISGVVMLLMFGCHLALARNPRRKTVEA